MKLLVHGSKKKDKTINSLKLFFFFDSEFQNVSCVPLWSLISSNLLYLSLLILQASSLLDLLFPTNINFLGCNEDLEITLSIFGNLGAQVSM